jgi:hypothetical protein
MPRTLEPETIRDKLESGEFRVAAVVNNWPQYLTQLHATHYMLCWEKSTYGDSWPKDEDVHNDLLD